MTGEGAPGRSAPAAAHVSAPATPLPGAPGPAAPAPGSVARGPAARALDDAFDAKVLRSFFREGRLVSIPAQDRKKRVVLRHLLDMCFPEDRAYPEKEVNQRLALRHPDVAALRRYLVDFRLMTRASGEYRRA